MLALRIWRWLLGRRNLKIERRFLTVFLGGVKRSVNLVAFDMLLTLLFSDNVLHEIGSGILAANLAIEEPP